MPMGRKGKRQSEYCLPNKRGNTPTSICRRNRKVTVAIVGWHRLDHVSLFKRLPVDVPISSSLPPLSPS